MYGHHAVEQKKNCIEEITIKKKFFKDISICCQEETPFRLKVRGLKKIYHANENEKEAEIAILTSDKIEFKAKSIFKKSKKGII